MEDTFAINAILLHTYGRDLRRVNPEYKNRHNESSFRDCTDGICKSNRKALNQVWKVNSLLDYYAKLAHNRHNEASFNDCQNSYCVEVREALS